MLHSDESAGHFNDIEPELFTFADKIWVIPYLMRRQLSPMNGSLLSTLPMLVRMYFIREKKLEILGGGGEHVFYSSPDGQHVSNWELIHRQAQRCVRLGVPVTIIAVMMKANYLRLADVARVAKRFGAPLRVNVYQAVRSDLYALTYEEYWQGFRNLFESTVVIAIGEPLVRAMAGLPPLEGGCGVSTVRVTPRATTQPCVYWPGSGEPLSELILSGSEILNSAPFEQARTLPEACRSCEFRDTCHGGCAGRRCLQGALRQPDFYCPIIRGERPRLNIRMAANRDLPKLGSSCTTVVIARGSDS